MLRCGPENPHGAADTIHYTAQQFGTDRQKGIGTSSHFTLMKFALNYTPHVIQRQRQTEMFMKLCL